MDRHGQFLSVVILMMLALIMIAMFSVYAMILEGNGEVYTSLTSSSVSSYMAEQISNQYSNIMPFSSSVNNTFSGMLKNFVAYFYPSYLISNGFLNYNNITVQYAMPPNITVPSNVQYYASVTLNNSQSSPTPAPFQQIINVQNTTSIWSYINTTSGYFGRNVEFFYANGNIIPSWLESYNSSSGRWWIKVGTISASSLTKIYIGFASNTTNLFNGVNVGEAPQLSSTYGEYDDGANVFLNYFSGASLSGWTTAGTSGQTTSAPSGNPIFGTHAFYANGSNGDYLYTTASEQSINMIIEFYGYTANLQDLYFLVNSTGVGQMMRDGNGGGWYGIASTSSWTSWNAPPDTGSWSNEWVTVGVIVAGGSATGYLSVGVNPYGSEIGSNPSNTYTVSNNGDYLGLIGDAKSGSTIQYWNGIIVRAYPPNGVMPSVRFGSVI
ncbi:MAG: DUF2341 domain-containing protein [Candidatus Acidifodinimicrobium sp.]